MPSNPVTTWITAREPVLSASIAKAALGAVGGFAVTHGWIGQTTDDTLIQTVTPVAVAVIILGIDWSVRHFVTPVAKIVAPVAAGLVPAPTVIPAVTPPTTGATPTVPPVT